MKYLQIILICFSFVAIIAVATIINTDVAWAQRMCNIVCDCEYCASNPELCATMSCQAPYGITTCKNWCRVED